MTGLHTYETLGASDSRFSGGVLLGRLQVVETACNGLGILKLLDSKLPRQSCCLIAYTIDYVLVQTEQLIYALRGQSK